MPLLTPHSVTGLPIRVATLYYLAAFLTSMGSITGGKVRRLSTENISILLQKWDLYVALMLKKIALEFLQQKG